MFLFACRQNDGIQNAVFIPELGHDTACYWVPSALIDLFVHQQNVMSALLFKWES